MTRFLKEMRKSKKTSLRSGASQEIWVTVMVDGSWHIHPLLQLLGSRFSLRTPTRRHRNVPDQNWNGDYLRNCDDGKPHLLIIPFLLMFCPAAWILPSIVRIENPSWVSAILMELSIGCFDRAVNAESPPKYSFCLPPPTHRIFTFEPIQILEW